MELQREKARPHARIPMSKALERRPSLLERVRSTPRPFLARALAGFGAYLGAMHFSTGNRPEQFALGALMLVLVVWSDGTRRFFTGMLPFLLFGMIYDLTHLTQPN